MSIPQLTTDQMREVDRLMIEKYQISLPQMMENAGYQLAELSRGIFLNGDPRHKNILVLAGTGGNGGGAIAAARRLHTWGANIDVFLSKIPSAYQGTPALQLKIVDALQVTIRSSETIQALPPADLILDGLIGYGLSGNPRGKTARMIQLGNLHEAPVLSLDTPSGLDTTTGIPADPCISAAATLTLALPKVGLMKDSARSHVGDLYLADISVPSGIYRELGLEIGPIFAEKSLLHIA